MVVLAAVKIAEKPEFEKKPNIFPKSPSGRFTIVFEFKTRYAPTPVQISRPTRVFRIKTTCCPTIESRVVAGKFFFEL